MALFRRDQGVRDDEVSAEASGAQPDQPRERRGIAGLIATVLGWRPVRVFLHYGNGNGPLLASGMTYQAFFALAAGLWFAFTVFGFALNGNPALQLQVFEAINRFLPGLIGYDVGGSARTGAIDGTRLIRTDGLTLAGVVSLVGVLLTAVGFLGTLRTAVRIMFGLPNQAANFAILKLKDLGLTVAFGTVVLLTGVISVVANTALDLVAGALGLGKATLLQSLLASSIAFVLLAVIESLMLAAAFRILSGIPIPVRRLWVGVLIGGVAMTLLQTVGSQLLSFGTSNPAIKVFAVLIGVLIFFNIICQIILIAASWVAVGIHDRGVDIRSLSPEQRDQEDAQRIEDARRLVARANREALEARIGDSSGLARWRLERELQREVRSEARRAEGVPTVSQFREAQRKSGDTSPDARQVDDTIR